jgi:hypothetical protein
MFSKIFYYLNILCHHLAKQHFGTVLSSILINKMSVDPFPGATISAPTREEFVQANKYFPAWYSLNEGAILKV